MVNIHLEKWLMRCDTKRAIWWNLYNKHISIFHIKHMSTIFRTLQVNNDSWKTKRSCPFARWMLLNLVAKVKFYTLSYIIIWLLIMIIVDFCMIWFHFDCIRQLKKSCCIATNVCSRKSATTFDDIPDCLSSHCPMDERDDILQTSFLKYIFTDKNYLVLIQMSSMSLLNCPVDNKSALA